MKKLLICYSAAIVFASPISFAESSNIKFLTEDEVVEIEAERQQSENTVNDIEKQITSQNICCSSRVPAGWIKINDHWSPTSCGRPTSIIYNVCTITKYSNKPVGSTMNVCSSAPTPSGWVVVNSHWSPTTCGHPPMIINNVKQIKRLN